MSLCVRAHASMLVRCGRINPLPISSTSHSFQWCHLLALKRNTHRLMCLEYQKHQQWPQRQSLAIDQSEWQWSTDERETVIGEAMRRGHKRRSLRFLADRNATAIDATVKNHWNIKMKIKNQCVWPLVLWRNNITILVSCKNGELLITSSQIAQK